jgi:hypothetical protein
LRDRAAHGHSARDWVRGSPHASADIRALFCNTCDLLGIEWRVMNARNISVARWASAALLDEFVGPKA